MKTVFLRTSRLGFALWEEADLPDALELWGDPEVVKFITANGLSKEQARQRLYKEIENYKDAGVQYWPVYLLETNRNIGCCGLRPYDAEKNTLELGIHLKKDYWGKGFAQEACSAVISYAFNRLKAEALFAGHNPNNTASARLLQKLGFKYVRDEYFPPTGLYHPSYLLYKSEQQK
ncbi:MAG TPA: GNAT family N-acetyltransferase [Ignavibacteriales bacterium]|nr:GNAT family N-acetyltransferase [Ignavibacteriales bacterium]